MSDSAIVFLSFNGTQIEGTCTLDSFSTTELANTSYDLEYENISGDLKQNGPVNVTVGDRASIIYWSSSDPPHEIWEESVIMQKGKWISSITLTGRLGPGFETSQILRIAQIQAAKLS
jgi:hypothetical protein